MTAVAVQNFLSDIKANQVAFSEVIAFIDAHFNYTPMRFVNGEVVSEVGINEGSAKVFGFGLLYDLSKEDTLKLFAEHYDHVLETPDGIDHPNIRQFMQTGWDGLRMPQNCLLPKG